eukprot:scaffold6914_cov58-Phaeocystis_antarctica.AAC.1
MGARQIARVGNWNCYCPRANPTRTSLRQYRLSARSLTPSVGSSEQRPPVNLAHTHHTAAAAAPAQRAPTLHTPLPHRRAAPS